MSRTKLLLLGTGTPNILPDRFQSAYAVIVDDQAYVVDCGGGTLQRISQARHTLGLHALALDRLTHLFITHLHPDHSTGLPDFIIAPWVEDRQPLSIFGPAGTTELVEYCLKAFEPGIAEHRDGLAPIVHPLDVGVSIFPVDGGLVFEDERLRVEAFPVDHGSMLAYGLKFHTPDRVIVFSGDTRPTPNLVEQARGCDILVHEVYSAEGFKTRSPEWQVYHQAMHTSTTELAEIASAVQPGLLILTHQLFWGVSENNLLAEVMANYDGYVVSGKDLSIY